MKNKEIIKDKNKVKEKGKVREKEKERKNSKELISVIIPVYNGEEYLKRCIDSVLNQTYKNLEIIVINDGSKDNSKSILDEYEKKYPDIIVHVDQENKGVAKTRNRAINMAKGEYITFCDNDDFFDEDYIETLYKNCENGKYDVVVSGYRRPNENGEIIKEAHLQDYEWSKYMIVTPWAKIFRKSYIIDNKIDYLSNDIGEDIYFNIQAMTLTKKIKIIDYVGYNWFYNTKSVSNTKHKDIRKIDIYKFLNNTYDVVKEKKILENNYEIIEMVFIKTVMWILTYSCKKLPYKVIKEEYEKLFNWLEERFPNYKKTKLIGFNKPEGEDKGNQRIYRVFMRLHKMHLGKLLIYFYSKV